MSVMRVLCAIAATGRTVVCTVQSAPLDAFSHLTQLLFLQQGAPAYCGPVGEGSADVLEYFAQFDGLQRPDCGGSPAMYLLQARIPHCLAVANVVSYDCTCLHLCALCTQAR